MTCIAAIAKDGIIYMGADSCSSDGYLKHNHGRAKVFNNGDFTIGVTGSWRFGQILEHVWSPPKVPKGSDDFDYLICEVVPSIKQCLEYNGHSKIDKNQHDADGVCILGYNNKIYVLQSDYSVIDPEQQYYAVGSGTKWALGSLYSSKSMEDDPALRIELAIEAAAHYSTTVGGPIKIISTKNKEDNHGK